MDRKPQVLVVDDEVYLREIIALDLETAGYDVLQAANGTEGLSIVKQQPVDLVVSDVRMPSGNGIKLLEQIRSLDPGRPGFIFITAYADVSSTEALSLGAEGFLRKPVDKDELLEVVSQALVPREQRWSHPAADFEGAHVLADKPAVLPGERHAEAKQIVIGQGGMCLAMSHDQPACYEIVQLDLSCPALSSGRLSGFGRVRWARREASDGFAAGVGIEFLSLSDVCRRDIVDYLTRQKPTAYVPLGHPAAAGARPELPAQG
jgi:CheY-like chemotaxis protein